MTDHRDMEAVIEAILFVAHGPVSRSKILEVFAEREREAAGEALDAVVECYRQEPGRGVMIDEVAGGLRLVSRPDLHGYLKKFFEVTSTNKLTMPALETLAIIAYRQPVTAPEIQELRNVNSTGVLKKLLERRLVRISGRKEVVGKPFLYATTREFLMHFGLKTLKELPPLEQFEELFGDEIEAPIEASPEPDSEELVDREAATLDAAEDEASAAAEAEEIEEQREAAEAAEETEPEAPAEEAPAEEAQVEEAIAEAPAEEGEAERAPAEEAEVQANPGEAQVEEAEVQANPGEAQAEEAEVQANPGEAPAEEAEVQAEEAQAEEAEAAAETEQAQAGEAQAQAEPAAASQETELVEA